jgi:hypothetical protein
MNTVPLQRSVRRIVPTAIIVVGLIVISVLLIQQVSAQEARTLKPPFKLIMPDRAVQRPAGISPLDAPIIVSQIFNSSYQPVTDLAQLGWHELVGQNATVGYTWKYAGTQPFTNTVWAAGRNPSGYPLLSPATGTYTNGMEALLAYGPLDMSDISQAVFTMTYWLDTAPGDWVGVAVSTDGSNFTAVNNESYSDPALSTARTLILNLSPFVSRQSAVWIAVYLKSDAKLPNGRGMFVHDVVVRGLPLAKSYMPLVMLGYPPATATPTPQPYRYLYTFSNGTTDFNRWGNYKETDCGSGCTYFQDLVTGYGNPSPAFTLWMQGTNGKGGAGPRQNGASQTTALNFEYSSDFYVYNGQLDARYGLAFDASSGTFPNSGDPPMDPYVNYYLLELRMDSSSRTRVARYQFLKIVNGARQGLTNATDLPISISQGQWHNVKVVQQGTTISFYLNGQFIKSTSYDSDWGDGRRRFGLYIDVRGSNGNNGPFEFFSDNITVRDLP